MDKNIKNTIQNKQATTESGRSLVEMLGTLAIMGVLSIGGIVGYTYAMNSVKANEILDGVARRAVVVSQQKILGRTASLVEYTGRKIRDYEVALKTKDYPSNQFGIEVSGIEEGVCERLQNLGISNAVKIELGGVGFAETTCAEGEVNVLTYVFNDTLESNKSDGDNDDAGSEGGSGTEGGDESDNPLECNPACESGQECIGGVCAEVTGQCSNNADCDDWCETNGEGEVCYCKIKVDDLKNDLACYNNFRGTCDVATTKSGIGGGYTASSDSMTWWSAVNFCKAHEKSLVSLADLGITGGYQDNGVCMGRFCICGEEKCTDAYWDDLYDKLGDPNSNHWTTDAVNCDTDGNCEAGINNNSCTASCVYHRVVTNCTLPYHCGALCR